MKRQLTKEEAIDRLETLCARSEQCSADIRNKLYRWGLSAYADEIVDHLCEQRYIDDHRFACAFVRDKYRFSSWGRNKITLGLCQKRIDRNTIAEALCEIDKHEYARIAFAAMRTCMRTLDTSDPAQRDKLIAFALRRGYESSLVFRLIDHLWPRKD